VVDRLVETVVLGYEFMQQPRSAWYRQSVYGLLQNRLGEYYEQTIPVPTEGIGLHHCARITVGERFEKNFPIELRPKVLQLFDEFESLFDMEDTSTTTTT
jgi:hypothetical protein